MTFDSYETMDAKVERGTVDSNANEVKASYEVTKQLPVTTYMIDVAMLYTFVLGFEIFCRSMGPYRQGFFCDDESIRLPLKLSTVPTTALFLYCYGGMLVAVVATEYYRLSRRSTLAEVYSEFEIGRSLPLRVLIRFFIFYGYYQLAFGLTWVLTTLAKYSVGRLRPHFLDACRPNVGYDWCNNTHHYITDYACAGALPKVNEARLSFFSGHSSLSMVASVYIVLYLQSRLHGQFRSRTALPLLQLAIMVLGMFISYSRVFDHMHHWSDVIIGIAVGTSIAFLVGIPLAGLFDDRTYYGVTVEERKALLASEPPTRLISMDSSRPSERTLSSNYDTSARGTQTTTNFLTTA